MGTDPGYWMYETSGKLRPAVEAYLRRERLSGEEVAILRAYFQQWIGSSLWDQNPHAGPETHAWLAHMRSAADGLRTQAAIDRWVEEAIGGGLDPL